MMGLSNGLFMSPNRAAVMNSLPAGDRGAGSGMTTTFQNSAQVFSIGIFFTLMIVGLSAVLPSSMYTGLVQQGVSPQVASQVAHLPPVSTLFAAFLGYNPMQHLLGAQVLAQLPAGHAAVIQGRSFFPHLISAPFQQGLHTAFDFAIGACLVAAAASWFRGERYVHVDEPAGIEPTVEAPASAPGHAGIGRAPRGLTGLRPEQAGPGQRRWWTSGRP